MLALNTHAPTFFWEKTDFKRSAREKKFISKNKHTF